MSEGKVFIIGAGPGDYKLLTLRGKEAIEKADTIVYDRLVNLKILAYCKEDAEKIYVGKEPNHHQIPQGEINSILVKYAKMGKIVARVKGGDPFVFGRGGEECEALLMHNINYEIIPGITSAIAVPAYAGIPVTHRDFSSSIHIITGHEAPGKTEKTLNYEILAKIDGTLIFLMGIQNLEKITASLIENGKNRNTPVAIIQNGTTSYQKTIFSDLGNIYEEALKENIKAPAITIIGDVVGLGKSLEWISKKPLFGKRILNTRGTRNGDILNSKIENLGGEVINYPLISIAKPYDFSSMDNAIDNIKKYTWLIFTSSNGVESFIERLKIRKIDIRELFGIKICCIGDGTKKTLENMGLIIAFMPKKYTIKDLGNGIIKLLNKDDNVLIARAEISNKYLNEILLENNIYYDDIISYRTKHKNDDTFQVLKMLENDEIDYITFTSSSTIESFIEIPNSINILNNSKCKVISIGPVTSNTAKENKIEIAATANTSTFDGIISKIIEIKEN